MSGAVPEPPTLSCAKRQRDDNDGDTQQEGGRPKFEGGGNHQQQYVLLLAYLGTPFRGLQIQAEFSDTVDAALITALHAAGLIPKADHKHAYLHRSCRTDKGVHALRNAVVVRLQNTCYNHPEDKEAAIQRVNAALPEDGCVRLLDITLVRETFRVRESCTQRRYLYFFPLFALHSESDDANDFAPHYAKDPDGVRAALTAAFNAQASKFVGVHKYHNFCGAKEKIPPWTQQASRVLAACGLVEGFCREMPTSPATATTTTTTPYVLFEVVGSSFLMNMIRKIMGVLIATVRGAVRADMLDDTIDAAVETAKKVSVPIAPGCNLYLHTPTFAGYDAPGYLKPGGKYVALCESWSARQSEIDAFEDRILAEVARLETETQSMTKFIRMLRMHNWQVGPYKKNK
eukprot:PhM_4_TR14359/c0_g1_i1/m.94034/K06173/truA, PUS1; tRNA pseudouridine38-40 synthase